jgi:iron complex outermembrane receptor protein
MKTMLKLALLAGACLVGRRHRRGRPGRRARRRQRATVEELVVTARRREETLKDVPVAVSAFSAETLERQGANDITTLSQTTPNITVQTARGSNSTLISYIRGIGQQDPLWGYEPGVGLYVDDVYIYRPQGAVLDVFDVSRIEVLRGPQGTLYGRNTIGGAIKYVTNRWATRPAARSRAPTAATIRPTCWSRATPRSAAACRWAAPTPSTSATATART